ncbi:MAG TPA: methyltransferase domain-containing protein [Candidatus Baltobacteraceae bacterium]|nr:methyltransferase domain-containing protein [Candidatus Baltobacteraceae bacterium]
MKRIVLDADEEATDANFDEARYLSANPDVRSAVSRGDFPSGRAHFNRFGKDEGRRLARKAPELSAVRGPKMERLRQFLRSDMEHHWTDDGKVSYITEALRQETQIVDTDNISSHGYDAAVGAMIDKYEDGLLLDCGAGRRNIYYSNVVNFEIVDYDTTDVLGLGEYLPFRDNVFDAVISVAVLEHVHDPFKCAAEIARVLKRGGELFCCVPFLQPLHGYPHHYFNATSQGIRSLFESALDVTDVTVYPSTHPVWAINWILNSWAQGLSEKTREEFLSMRVSEFLAPPPSLLTQAFAADLSMEKQLELACATVLTARKVK